MKWPLYKALPRRIRNYKLDLSFSNVLRYMDLCENKDGLTDDDIIDISFEWFVGTKKVTQDTKIEILNEIFSEYINPPRRKLKNNSINQAVVDFNIDSGYIYASFMQAYGIDLYDNPELHWCKFIALFEGLPEDCIIKQIMHIRAQEIPKPTKYNAEEIQRITELKTLYALPSATDESSLLSSLDKLFDTMERQAKS